MPLGGSGVTAAIDPPLFPRLLPLGSTVDIVVVIMVIKNIQTEMRSNGVMRVIGKVVPLKIAS